MSDQNIQYKFDDFVLLTKENLLLQNGKIVPLTYRACKVLELMVSKSGRLIQKQEFMDTIWKDSFVEEGNLPVAINAIRKILHKDGKVMIETFSRRGYRFNCQVEKTFIVETEQVSTSFIYQQNIQSENANFLEKPKTHNSSPKPANFFFRLWKIVPVKLLQLRQPASPKQNIQGFVTI